MGRGLGRVGRVGAVLLPFALAACQTLIKSPQPCDEDGCPPRAFGTKPMVVHEPKVATNPTMHTLASDLDHLEKHIDWYGSVVAKAPDVWGQARLTRYREEFDILMDPINQEDNKFHAGLQGSLARSDQAFFAHATALSLAAQPKPPVIGRVSVGDKLVPQSHDVTVVRDTVAEKTVDGVKTTEKTTDSSKQGLPQAEKPAEGPIKAAQLADPKSLLTDPDNAIKRELVAGRGIGFGNLKTQGIGLEPSLYIAQKKRHLDFLNQIRRENEGADTADGPGYSLNLVRIPVSVLPGKRTDEGHGAEVTMTLTPVLGDDLLPATFRNLVVNDLLHQLGFPLTQVLNGKDLHVALSEENRQGLIALPKFNLLTALLRKPNPEKEIGDLVLSLTPTEISGFKQIAKLLGSPAGGQLLELIEKREDARAVAAIVAVLGRRTGSTESLEAVCIGPICSPTVSAIKQTNVLPGLEANQAINQKLNTFNLKLRVPPMSYSPGLSNKTGFPTSQLVDVYGLSDCFQITFAAYSALKESITRQGYAHLPDIQGFLQQEAAAALRFLAEPDSQILWKRFCTREIVTAVRTRRVDILQDRRTEFRAEVKRITRSGEKAFNEPGEYSTTAALAWCILVDSALLNDRLERDMREAASAQKRPVPPEEYWPEYFLPNPPAEARCAFNAYVAMRWPIRVFALDPYTQDQNIADQFSSRREMQLALAIAFTNGFIGANTLTKYTRRLEAEYETIALNRTQVGFSHGENTFGWRFYPRFQTPDTEGNLTVFVRDQLIGGPSRNALLRQRRIEPGPRECVAVVMMPSFVPYATLDTTSNWFGLANPKHKVLDHTQALKLSHTVHAIKNGGCGVKDAGCYRDGELDRLLRRAEQLEARLPAQTLSVPVPVINTLGGFEMFNNGVTDLAPELYGWYGAPGISADDDTTTLFLVGDHFSPLNTKVLVGNRAVTNAAGVYNQKMLSRQVVQVTVTRGTLTVPVLRDGRPFVAAHIATPYGVTRELLIPVVSAKAGAAPPRAGFAVGESKLAIQYAARPGAKTDPGADKDKGADKKDPGGAKEFGVIGVSKELKFKWAWSDPSLSTAAEVLIELEFADLQTTDGTKVALTMPCGCKLKAKVKATSATEADVVIAEEELQRLAVDLLRELTTAKVAETTWGGGLTTTKVLVTPVAPPGQTSRAVVANDQLTIEFKRVAHCGTEVKPKGCAPPIPPAEAALVPLPLPRP